MSVIQVHGPYLTQSSTTGPATKVPGHHGRRIAIIALSGAAVVLATMAGVQYLRTQVAEPPVASVATVPTVVVPHGALAADAAGKAAPVASVTTVPTIVVPHGALAPDAAG